MQTIVTWGVFCVFMFVSTYIKLKCKNSDILQTTAISKSSESNNTTDFPMSESNFLFSQNHHAPASVTDGQPILVWENSIAQPAEEVLITSILLRFLFAAQISLLCFFLHKQIQNRLRQDSTHKQFWLNLL